MFMFYKKLKLIIIIFLLYQIPLYSKSTSFYAIDSKNLSKYFSGIVASGNKDNSTALEFFNSSKILINNHDPYLEKYVNSLVLENKVSQAISLIQNNKDKKNINFFDANLLLILDSLKKSEFNKADVYLQNLLKTSSPDGLNSAIIESLKQYIYVFKHKKFLKDKKNLGKLTLITETFQKCYLSDIQTENYFSNLINDNDVDYTRYIYFYLSFLVENNRIEDAKKITDDLEFTDITLLLSQGKSWIENGQEKKFNEVFSCKNHNDIISEFFFIISNLYSSQDNFEKSNFYLNLSNFLNPKFIFNLSLVAENQYLNEEYKESKKTLKNFKKEDVFYYWFRIKKQAQIILKEKNERESLNYINVEFNKIDKPNLKILFDIANFYRNLKEYETAINFYTKIINTIENDSKIKPDVFYRRGGSYERIGDYEKADKDLLYSLQIKPDDAYVLNYLAYSWLERNYKIKKAIEMLEKAYSLKANDPYIIDSIGWAYYLVNDYLKAETFLKRAVELMPDDPIVNDHYGDILWKLDRKIQARYFWANVLKMSGTKKKMIKKINIKMIKGLENS